MAKRSRYCPRWLLLLSVVLPAQHPPRPAASFYVRSITDKGHTPLRWMYTTCVAVRPHADGSADVQDGSDIEAIRRAAENWHTAIESCSYIRLDILDPSPAANLHFAEFGENENVIRWVESGWRHDDLAAGITTVFFVDDKGSTQDGRILDADVEINGEFFTYATTGDQERTDVENTLTHELGHVIGLDHPCDDGARRPLPPDDAGNPIPRCKPEMHLPQWLKDLTMYNFAELGETKKRSLEPEDIRGICEVYPIGEEPARCVHGVDLTRSGCRIGAGAAGGSWWPQIALIAALALFGLASRRRTTRR